VAGKQNAVNVVKLSAEERERLEALIRAGKSTAQVLTGGVAICVGIGSDELRLG
jgi:hypothetical protein